MHRLAFPSVNQILREFMNDISGQLFTSIVINDSSYSLVPFDFPSDNGVSGSYLRLFTYGSLMSDAYLLTEHIYFVVKYSLYILNVLI